jgi:hypothetical protein
MTPTNITSTLRTALSLIAVCVLTTPAAAGAQDLRSPDARDAAQGRYLSAAPAGPQDLRSPDARDAANSSSTTTPQPPTTSTGLDWPSAAFGAVLFGGLVLLGFAGPALVRHRRTRANA